MTFGDKLRALRKARGMTQGEAVALFKRMFPVAHMSQAVWSALETRNRAPREQLIDCLCILFGVSPDELIPPPPQQPWRDSGTLDQLIEEALKEAQPPGGGEP